MAATAPWSVILKLTRAWSRLLYDFFINFEKENRVQMTHLSAIGACKVHFNDWGPVPNLALRAVIQQIAASVVASH